MIREGLCDESSLVLMPTADGENHTHAVCVFPETRRTS